MRTLRIDLTPALSTSGEGDILQVLSNFKDRDKL